MAHGEERYKLQDYDHILLVASWGSPKEYKEAKYVVELEIVRDREIKRCIEILDEPHYSSTTALKNLLKNKLNIDKNKLSLLIFAQDTIFLSRIIENGGKYFDKIKTISRYELKTEFLQELYEQNMKVARELGVLESAEYDKHVRFVPGVITIARGTYLYTWRYERCYDLLLAGIILHAYEKIEEIRKNKSVGKIAILIDSTHGINYFVTALKEGILKATALYALGTSAEEFDDGAVEGLKEITVYHYNSDPIGLETNGTPSLKLHLLDKNAIVKGGKPLLNSLFSVVEDQVSREGLEELSGQLNTWWRDVDWKKVVEALLLFSRGLLVWALRAILDVPSLPHIMELKEVFNDIKLEFSNRDTSYSIDYKPEAGRNPLARVVEYSLMASSLKKLAEKSGCTSDVYNKGFEFIEKVSQELKSELEKEGLHEALQNIMKHKNEYQCFRLEKIQQVTELMYTSPYFDIVENEIKNIDEYLRRDIKDIGWRRLNNHVYKERRCKPAYIIDYNYSRLLISKADKVSVENRVIYAHAGLAYGLPWFAFKLKENSNIILYLGSPDKVVHILHADAYAK
jgi:CRISPR/Cas system-associated protein Csx1